MPKNLLLSLLLFSTIVNLNATDNMKTIVTDGCQNLINKETTNSSVFINGYIKGYVNAFRTEMRDFKMNMKSTPLSREICLTVLHNSNSLKIKNYILLLNISTEKETLRVNGYEYQDYADKKLSVKNILKTM